MSRSVLFRSLVTALVAMAALSLTSACGGSSDKPATIAALAGGTSVHRLDRDKDGIPDQSDQLPGQA